MFTASEIFDLAIQVEVNGEDFYRGALGRVAQNEVKELLGWLADHEARHRSEFEDLKDRFRGQSGKDPISGATGDALRSAMGRHAFSLDELEINSIQDVKEILRAAIEFEEDAILFYEFIGSLINDAHALATIAEIRSQEMDHRDLLMRKMSEM